MLNRAIKLLMNKPTEIKNPVFLKHFNKENSQIKDLEELLKTCDETSRKYIEQDIKKLKYGQIGENNVYYELINSFIPMICMHDLRLKYRGKIAQIDFLALTSKYIYVIECKNLMGDISITQEGEFIRYMKNSQGKVVSKQGMYSPIVQNERHINVIKEILSKELNYKNKLNRIESLVVTANPKTIINKKYAPKQISEKIIRHDQIIDKIKEHQNNRKIEWVFIEEDMREIARCLSKFHREAKIDYDKKYSLSSSKDNIKTEDNYYNTKVERKYSSYENTSHTNINKDFTYSTKEFKQSDKGFETRQEIKSKSEEELRNSLKSYRLFTSRKEGIQPYMVFNNDTMEELIIKRPKSLYELRNIKGFGPVKCEKYGMDLINIIK